MASFLRTINHHRSWVGRPAWSPDGRKLACPATDGVVTVWTEESERPVREYRIPTPSDVDWSPDGRRLVVAGANNRSWVVEADSGDVLFELVGHTDTVFACAWAPDGEMLATGSADNTVRIWNATQGACLTTLRVNSTKLIGPPLYNGELILGWVIDLAWHPGGRLLAAACIDGYARIWDAKRETLVQRVLVGESLFSVCWNRSSELAIGGSGKITIWDSRRDDIACQWVAHAGSVNSLSYAANDAALASKSTDGTIRLWQGIDYQKIDEIKAEAADNYRTGISFNPVTDMLAIVTERDLTVELWSVPVGRQATIEESHRPAIPGLRLEAAYAETGDRINQFAWEPEGEHLVSVSQDGTLLLWQPGNQEARLLLHSDLALQSVSWSIDGRLAVGDAEGGIVICLPLHSNMAPTRLCFHEAIVNALAWSPDSKSLLSASNDGTAVIWDVERLDPRRVFSHTGPQLGDHSFAWVFAAAWSPDGRQIATAAFDATVRIWKADSGRPVRVIDARTRAATSLAWGQDGSSLASGGMSGEVVVWDVSSGNELKRLAGSEGSTMVTALAYSKCGRLLLARYANNHMRIWRTDDWRSLSIKEFAARIGYWSPSFALHPHRNLLALTMPGNRSVRVFGMNIAELEDAAIDALPAKNSGHQANSQSYEASPHAIDGDLHTREEHANSRLLQHVADTTIQQALATWKPAGHGLTQVTPSLLGAGSTPVSSEKDGRMAKIKILFLAANPITTSRLDLEEELHGVEQELRAVKFREYIEIVTHHAVRPDDLLRYVRSDQPTIIHFSGHGSPSGIVLRTDSGEHQTVPSGSLQRFLKGRGVDLVVLNACFTVVQAEEIACSVRAVIGTSAAVGDEAAKRFSCAFYRSLGDGLTVADAFRDGGDAVALHGLTDVFQHVGKLDWKLVGA